VLRKPPLYLSLYLKTHRADYYRLLQEIREHGAWEAWLDFFLTGVADTADQTFDAATRIVELFKQDRERITGESGSALRIHDLLRQNLYLTANLLVARTGLSAPTVNAALADLERLGIVEEVTGRRRGRVFGLRRSSPAARRAGPAVARGPGRTARGVAAGVGHLKPTALTPKGYSGCARHRCFPANRRLSSLVLAMVDEPPLTVGRVIWWQCSGRLWAGRSIIRFGRR